MTDRVFTLLLLSGVPAIAWALWTMAGNWGI